MKRGKNNKKKSPSRENYEKENPTVSGRMPKEKRDKLLAVLRSLGLSLTNLLVSFADEYEVKVIPINEAKKEGYEEAKNRYMVPFPCSECGEMIPITGKKAKEAVMEFMIEHGWRHAECHKQKRRQ